MIDGHDVFVIMFIDDVLIRSPPCKVALYDSLGKQPPTPVQNATLL